MFIKMFIKMFIRMLFLCLSLWAVSINANANVFWADLTLGRTNIGNSAGLKFNILNEEKILSVGFSQINQGIFLGLFNNADEYKEVYVAYGLKKSGDGSSYTAQVGIGAFEKRSQNKIDKTIGIPIILTTSFGEYVNLNVNFNINDIKPMASISISFLSRKFGSP